MNTVFKNLKVNPEKMLENLERSQGLPMSEAIMTKLVEKGLGRGEAHELLRQCSLKAAQENVHLRTVLSKEKKVSKLLNKKELDETLNPKNYLGSSEQIVEMIVKKLSR